MLTVFILLVSLLGFTEAQARTSALLSKLQEALLTEKSLILREDLLRVRRLLETHGIPGPTQERWRSLDPADHLLRRLPSFMSKSEALYPPLSIHAHSFLVAEDSDDVFNDDIYVSFFITDGHVPTGKVSSVYRGLDEGDRFFFLPNDRFLFPLSADGPRVPSGHLIIDYMIIESDGDDLRELKKISAFITDLALAYYAEDTGEPLRLREEVRALSEALLDLDHDDRMVTATWAPGPWEVAELLPTPGYAEVTKTHKKSSTWSRFKYKLTFRILR